MAHVNREALRFPLPPNLIRATLSCLGRRSEFIQLINSVPLAFSFLSRQFILLYMPDPIVFPQVRLTTRRFGDIAPVRKKGCLNFLYRFSEPDVYRKGSKSKLRNHKLMIGLCTQSAPAVQPTFQNATQLITMRLCLSGATTCVLPTFGRKFGTSGNTNAPA
jgi:hypothetical protein